MPADHLPLPACGKLSVAEKQTIINLDRDPLSRPVVRSLNGQAGGHVFESLLSSGHSVLRAVPVSLTNWNTWNSHTRSDGAGFVPEGSS